MTGNQAEEDHSRRHRWTNSVGEYEEEMEKMSNHGAKKPDSLSKRRKIFCVACICLVLAGVAKVANVATPDDSTLQQPAHSVIDDPASGTLQDDEQSKLAPSTVLDSFASAIGQQPSSTEEFKTTTDSAHSRLEYRLSAFEDGSGLHAQFDGFAVDVITYSGGTSLRAYLDGDDTHVSANYAALVKAIDNDASDDQIQRDLDAFTSTGSGGGSVSDGTIANTSIGKVGSITEALIDAKIG